MITRRKDILASLVVLLTGLHSFESFAAESSTTFEVYGFAQGDYIQDFKRVDPAWNDTLRPTRIPTTEGEDGSDGLASLSVKQSRLGVQGSVPAGAHDAFARVEFDFFGVGDDEGKVTPRLRHAYGEWGHWLGGQTHSLFMDIDVFPNVIDYWGPSGLVFLRNPQLRYTPFSGDNSFAIAIERPGNDVDPGRLRELAPDFSLNVRPDNKLPDLTAQFKSKRSWGHWQLAGILRRIGFDTLGTTDNEPNGHEMAWGLDLTSNVKVTSSNKLLLSVVYGHGIANYMNDGGNDLAPAADDGQLSANAVPLLGVSGYLEHAWNDRFTTALGYSRTQVENTTFQGGDAFRYGQYASGNLLFTPAKNVLMGLELLWGKRTDNSGASGDDIRTQVSFRYSFSSKDYFAKQ